MRPYIHAALCIKRSTPASLRQASREYFSLPLDANIAATGNPRDGNSAGYSASPRNGFAKNEQDNIDPDELLTLKEIAAGWLKANDREILQALNEDGLKEVKHGEESKT